MIEISLTTALALYSGIIVLGTLTIWIATEISTRLSHRVLEKQHLWRCVYCAYVYLDREAQDVSQCPRCKSYNAASDKKARWVRVSPSTERESPGDDTLLEAAPRRNPSRGKKPGARRRGPRRRR